MIYIRRKPLRTHCQRGHEFNEKNTKITKRDGRSTRGCRKCLAEADKQYRVRAKNRDLGIDDGSVVSTQHDGLQNR